MDFLGRFHFSFHTSCLVQRNVGGVPRQQTPEGVDYSRRRDRWRSVEIAENLWTLGFVRDVFVRCAYTARQHEQTETGVRTRQMDIIGAGNAVDGIQDHPLRTLVKKTGKHLGHNRGRGGGRGWPK